MSSSRDLVEIFGFAADDTTKLARSLWQLGACPFTGRGCIKFNHDKSITYGTCSATSPYGDLVICPNRLYANNYEIIRRVAEDAFGAAIPFYMFDEYVDNRLSPGMCVVALGAHSGKEVKVGRSMSVDWVLVLVRDHTLLEYVGIEIQSIDITGNYRDTWHAYHNMDRSPGLTAIPSSHHGMNWANVHKRLIPQLIRKGTVFATSSLVKRGLYFVVPDPVYRKFEELLGVMPECKVIHRDTLTVFTYDLGDRVPPGAIRALKPVRTMRFDLDELKNRFITGPSLPSGVELDQAVRRMLGIESLANGKAR